MCISFDTDNLLTLLKVVVGVFFFRKYSCTVSVTLVFVCWFFSSAMAVPWVRCCISITGNAAVAVAAVIATAQSQPLYISRESQECPKHNTIPLSLLFQACRDTCIWHISNNEQ